MIARDVQPFLFKPQDARKVELFREFIVQAPLHNSLDNV